MHFTNNPFIQPPTIEGVEVMERELLRELRQMKGAARKEKPQGTTYVKSRGFCYDMSQGDIAGNTMSAMIIVSVGNQFPFSVEVEQRIRNSALADEAFKVHGQLPPFVTCLHKEAAADLMATASNSLNSSNVNLFRICIDSPFLQCSKNYYLEKITDFFLNSEDSVGKTTYKINGSLCVTFVFPFYHS